MIVKNNHVASLAVEDDPSKVTVTSAKMILTALSFMFLKSRKNYCVHPKCNAIRQGFVKFCGG